MKIAAVLTGDLVNSSELDDASLFRARETLLDAATEMVRWDQGLLGSRPEFFRGDSWQLLLSEPRFCLRAAIFLRARLRAVNEGWDTRLAIGLGGVSRVDKNRTSLSSGEAFRISGMALDNLGSVSSIVVVIGEGIRRLDGLPPLARLCSILVDDWSRKQAEAAALALVPDPPTQAEIAQRLGISQQAVSKALSAGKVGALLEAIAYCEGIRWANLPRAI